MDEKLTYKYTDKQVDIRRMVFDLKSKFETNFKTDQEQFFISLSDAGLGEIIEKDNKKTFKLNRQGIIVVEEIMRVLVEESQKLGGNE